MSTFASKWSSVPGGTRVALEPPKSNQKWRKSLSSNFNTMKQLVVSKDDETTTTGYYLVVRDPDCEKKVCVCVFSQYLAVGLEKLVELEGLRGHRRFRTKAAAGRDMWREMFKKKDNKMKN